jgi:hypothetical protein
MRGMPKKWACRGLLISIIPGSIGKATVILKLHALFSERKNYTVIYLLHHFYHTYFTLRLLSKFTVPPQARGTLCIFRHTQYGVIFAL